MVSAIGLLVGTAVGASWLLRVEEYGLVIYSDGGAADRTYGALESYTDFADEGGWTPTLSGDQEMAGASRTAKPRTGHCLSAHLIQTGHGAEIDTFTTPNGTLLEP